MNGFNRFLVAASLSAAMLLPGVAQAMQIQQFDKMADQDQGDYIGDLIVGAENVLTGEGRADLAAQVKQLFTTKNPGDLDTIGMVEFELNLARARVADAKRAAQNPNARRLEVEDAMAVTLKKNGIDLPDSFFTVNKNFKPKHPIQSKDKKN
jgi:hypothetical protein